MTEPMKARRIQARGPPTEASSETMPETITMDGPMDANSEDLAASFICSLVTPIFGPVAHALFRKSQAWKRTSRTAGMQEIHMPRLFAVFKYSSSIYSLPPNFPLGFNTHLLYAWQPRCNTSCFAGRWTSCFAGHTPFRVDRPPLDLVYFGRQSYVVIVHHLFIFRN